MERKIYHIVHVDNLASICQDRFLWSDFETQQRQTTITNIGMSDIKKRRLNKACRPCYEDLFVGYCVPFYFCPRSVMLCVISQQNHSGLTYKDGQEPIVTLEADLKQAVEWANKENHRWVFSPSNAAAGYTQFYNDLKELDKIEWDAVQAHDWRDPRIKERKQAEFLIEKAFPWHLIERIGVYSEKIASQVCAALRQANNRPKVEILENWYY